MELAGHLPSSLAHNMEDHSMKTKNATLLIVDDDESQRLFLQKAFECAYPGHRIYGLASGNEAVAYLTGHGKYSDRTAFPFPSSVITDLKMPDGDGFAILEFLKSNPTLSVVPVVLLSNSDDPDDVRQAYLLGANAYFVKPASYLALEDLARRIHDYWARGEVPHVDANGYAIETASKGKLGERFSKPKRLAAQMSDAAPAHGTWLRVPSELDVKEPLSDPRVSH